MPMRLGARRLIGTLLLGGTLSAACADTIARSPAPAPSATAREGTDAVPATSDGDRDTPASGALVAVAASANADATKSGGDAAVLAFAGDVIAHDALREAAGTMNRQNDLGQTLNASGYGAIFDAARPTLARADLAFANLESPVTAHQQRQGSMVFRGEEALLEALGGAGFHVVSVANNHAYDQGARGLRDTLAAVGRHGLLAVGAGPTMREACAPALLDVRGIKIALLARTLYMNVSEGGPPAVCRLALGPLTRDVRAARAAGAHLVITSLHWGNEYETAPRREQVDYARALVERGVDLVIGHHPHVLQRVERIATKEGEGVVAYSLGNLVSNQGYAFDPVSSPESAGDTRDGAILLVRIERPRDGQRRARVSEATAVPFWTAHEGPAIVLRPATTRRPRIQDRLGIPLVDPPTSPPPTRAREDVLAGGSTR